MIIASKKARCVRGGGVLPCQDVELSLVVLCDGHPQFLDQQVRIRLEYWFLLLDRLVAEGMAENLPHSRVIPIIRLQDSRCLVVEIFRRTVEPRFLVVDPLPLVGVSIDILPCLGI